MKFETVLNAYTEARLNRRNRANTYQYVVFRIWLLRRDEKQAAEIARLQAQVATAIERNNHDLDGWSSTLKREDKLREENARLQVELDGDDLMAGEAEMFRPEYEKQLEAENVRLQAEIDALKASWGETLEGSGCRL